MPLDVKAYRILIASPGDVANERTIVREQIAQWNAMHTQDMRIMLMPVGWETDSTPSLEDRGQAVINRQLVDSCDLVIGVFWTRLGTPTTEAESGTVEEIERANNEGKRCIVYFSDQQINPSQIDKKQSLRLQKYKKELQPKGLTDSYSTLEEFKNKVFRHITSAILEIIREDKERRAAEQEAKLTEQAIGLSIQPGTTLYDSVINIASQANVNNTKASISFTTLTEAQTSIKTLLASRFGIQEVEDIKEREIARIQSVLISPDFVDLLSRKPTVENIPVITQILETVTTPSMYVLYSIARYADDTSIDWLDLAGEWIERISTREMGGYEWASYIKTYPGLLLLYTLGISSLRSGKLAFLKEVSSRQIFYSAYDYEGLLLDALNPWYVFHNDVSKFIEPGFEQKLTPVSDHLTHVLKEKLYFIEEENRYLSWFDFFEFLISFKAAQQNLHPYFGSFIWRHKTRLFLIKMIQDAAVQKGKYGTAIQDFFGGVSDFKAAAHEYDKNANASRRDFGRAGSPGYIENLIQFANQGIRVTSLQDLYKRLGRNNS